MSLTKNDLKQINHLFIQGIESLILPQFEEIRADIAELQEDVSGLKEDVSGLKKDVSGLKKDVSSLKKDVSSLKQDVSSLKEGQKQLREDLNMHVVSLHTRIDENTALIGIYFENCVTKKDHKTWEKRVERLEAQTV